MDGDRVVECYGRAQELFLPRIYQVVYTPSASNSSQEQPGSGGDSLSPVGLDKTLKPEPAIPPPRPAGEVEYVKGVAWLLLEFGRRGATRLYDLYEESAQACDRRIQNYEWMSKLSATFAENTYAAFEACASHRAVPELWKKFFAIGDVSLEGVPPDQIVGHIMNLGSAFGSAHVGGIIERLFLLEPVNKCLPHDLPVVLKALVDVQNGTLTEVPQFSRQGGGDILRVQAVIGFQTALFGKFARAMRGLKDLVGLDQEKKDVALATFKRLRDGLELGGKVPDEPTTLVFDPSSQGSPVTWRIMKASCK